MVLIHIIKFIMTIFLLNDIFVNSKHVVDIVNNHVIKNSDEFKNYVDIGYGFSDKLEHHKSKTPFTVIRSQGSADFLPVISTDDIIASEHDGTHLDAPFHFNKTGWKIADIPLDNLLVPGILLDMRNKTSDNVDFLITVKHIMDWQHKHGEVPSKSVLLINFGWASRWADKNSYLGFADDDETVCHFPGISEEAAKWIVDSKKIVGVGVDTASVDVGAATDFKVHQILSSANIYNIENVNFDVDAELPARGFDLIVMPTKINEAGGAPCRIIAVPPNYIHNKQTYTKYMNSVSNRLSNNIALFLQLVLNIVSYLLLNI